MKEIYALKNRLVNSWTDPHFDNCQPEDKRRYLFNFCFLNPEKALEQHLNECDLYHLGAFDDEKGSFILNDSPVFLVSLDQPFEQLKKAQLQNGIETPKAN